MRDILFISKWGRYIRMLLLSGLENFAGIFSSFLGLAPKEPLIMNKLYTNVFVFFCKDL